MIRKTSTHFIKANSVSHIDAIAGLARKIWPPHYIPIIGRPQVEYMLKKYQSPESISDQIHKEGFLYYLIKDNQERTIGYLGLQPRKKSHELFLSKIYILAEERHKGYGSQALCFINSFARRKHLKQITLTVNRKNKDTINAYLSMGFRKAACISTPIGSGFKMRDFKMVKMIQ